jgi:hypothetical protein
VLRGSEDVLICDLHNGDVAYQNIPILLLRISPLLGSSEFSMDTSSTFNVITVISPMFVSHFLFKYNVEFLHEVQKNTLSAGHVL